MAGWSKALGLTSLSREGRDQGSRSSSLGELEATLEKVKERKVQLESLPYDVQLPAR